MQEKQTECNPQANWYLYTNKEYSRNNGKLWINQIFFVLPLSDKRSFLFKQVNLPCHRTGTLPCNILKTLITLQWTPYTLLKVKLCSEIWIVVSLDLSSEIHTLAGKKVQSFKSTQVEISRFFSVQIMASHYSVRALQTTSFDMGLQGDKCVWGGRKCFSPSQNHSSFDGQNPSQ